MRRWKAIEATDRRWSITRRGHTPRIKRKRTLDPNTREHCMSTPALQIKDLHAWYGESHILHGVDLTVNRGEVVTLLGRNGAGRTTTLRAIMG
ncbi:ATP-binding cassette domain-containing protein, partial [Microbacterium trichothecenolyticum]|uniref:ATP-binding cassette domain-containing protein n=1 Tax=Microbacterium trichothecenolyticum TaxID=69370 RepID=UPI003F769CA4